MGVFQRIADVMSANINDMLDKAENPEKMAKQYLRQAMGRPRRGQAQYRFRFG